MLSFINYISKVLVSGIVLLYSHHALACTDTIKVSAAKNWPPYSYLEQGVFKGLDIDIIELVLTNANLCWQYSSYPSSARSIKELINNRVDLVFAASWNNEREKYARFTRPYRTESMLLFSHLDRIEPFNFDSTSTVAINRGGYYGNKFSSYIAKCESCVVEVNLAHQRFSLLQNKRVDFSIEDELTGAYAMENGNFYNIKKHTDIIHNNHVHYMLGLSERGDMIKMRLNKAIKELDVEISDLIQQYKNRLNKHN